MLKRFGSHLRHNVAAYLALVFALGAAMSSAAAQAATPSSGTIDSHDDTVSWKREIAEGPLTGSILSGPEFGGPGLGCGPSSCDDFLLTVALPPPAAPAKSYIEVTLDSGIPDRCVFAVFVYEPWAISRTDDYEGVFCDQLPVRFVAPDPGPWAIRIACAACGAGATYTASAKAGIAEPPDAPLPPQGPVSFSNVRLPGTGSGEPGVAIASDDRVFVDGPFTRAGPSIWRSDDSVTFKRTSHFDTTPIRASADTALAVAPDDPATVYAVNASQPAAASRFVLYVSRDRGETFPRTPTFVTTETALDRPWLAAGPNGVVYLVGRLRVFGSPPAVPVFFRSEDRGKTFTRMQSPTQPNLEAGCPKLGRPMIDASADNYPDTVYVPYRTGTPLRCAEGDVQDEVWMAKSTDGGATWTNRPIARPAGTDIFSQISGAIDRDGTIYVVFAPNERDATGPTHVKMSVSKDGGETWGDPFRVDQLDGQNSNIQPVVAARNGRVDVAWYTAEPASFRAPDADWTVAFARSMNAASATPRFRQSRVSEGVVHQGDYLPGGDPTGASGPTLADFLDLRIGPDGRASVVWANTVYGAKSVGGSAILSYYGQSHPGRISK